MIRRYVCSQCGKHCEAEVKTCIPKFCPECRQQHKKATQTAYHQKTYKPKNRTFQCNRCGKTMTATRPSKYCPECEQIVHREQNAKYYQKRKLAERLELIKERWALLQERKKIA